MDLILTTPEQLRLIVSDCLTEIYDKHHKFQEESPKSENHRYEYSTKGASMRLGISEVTFQKWKNARLFKYTQIGRKCIYDIPSILEDLSRNKK
jgi:hypothetical protein